MNLNITDSRCHNIDPSHCSGPWCQPMATQSSGGGMMAAKNNGGYPAFQTGMKN